LLRRNSEAMRLHLEEIAFHVAPGAHAVLERRTENVNHVILGIPFD